MVYPQYLSVNESMTSVLRIVVGAENHDVAVGCSWVEDILSSVNVVGGVIESGKVVAIHMIVLKDNCVGVSQRWHIFGLNLTQ